MYSIQCIEYSVYNTVYSIQCIEYSVQHTYIHYLEGEESLSGGDVETPVAIQGFDLVMLNMVAPLLQCQACRGVQCTVVTVRLLWAFFGRITSPY